MKVLVQITLDPPEPAFLAQWVWWKDILVIFLAQPIYLK